MRRLFFWAIAVGLCFGLALLLTSSHRDEGRPEAATDTEALLALRSYEELLHGNRSGVYEVRWTRAVHEGRPVIRDVTRYRQRTVRTMGRIRDVFETSGEFDLLRTEKGDLIQQEALVRLPSRMDREKVVRTPTGYSVTAWTGENRESFEIVDHRWAKVDAESFLGGRIRSGEAKPGMTFTYPALSTARRRLIDITLKVVGQDEEGPGLKVVESFEGNDGLWWFAQDGSVVRRRVGDLVIRRSDDLDLEDLPRLPAAYPTTLPANVNLPRVFTAQRMLVDIEVEVDETVRPPKFTANPFTEVVEEGEDTVRVLLKSHDDPEATVELPLSGEGFEEFLKPTPLMEVHDPSVVAAAREMVGDTTDARTAATRIADGVFRLLRKGSPDIPQPSAKRILELEVGDCSEHALLFTALCRAAGIPARRCSGFVCIGGDWGSHGWSEIWLGRWIGADPTTNEIGTRARYIFCGRPDEPEVRVASMSVARTTLLIRRAEFVDGTIDFDGEVDPVIFTGIQLGEPPASWSVRNVRGMTSIMGPGFRVDATLQPDQGYRALDLAKRWYHFRGTETSFGGRPALVRRFPQRSGWLIPLGRQILFVHVSSGSPETEVPHETIEELFRPTLEREE
ncbi:MAG: transglutaminase-like domain-containing protein [Planctomycetota bacterium]|jgi:transglutaminase-like putative cysteine protease